MDTKEGIGHDKNDPHQMGHYPPAAPQPYPQQFLAPPGVPPMPPAYAMNPFPAGMPGMGMPAPKMTQPPPVPAPATGKSSGTRFKKAPDAPKRFKSAFIIFSAEKHKKIKAKLASEGRVEKTTDIAKLVSEAWREMPPDEKEHWEEKARQDKARYEIEKSMYKGPWKIPANKRTPKDPSAPKRPMSAFLAFSNKRRAGLKRQHPDATNADLSKMLSKTWKECPLDLKGKYTEEEKKLREDYKIRMAAWRKKVSEEKKAERKEREALAMQAAEARQLEAQNGGGDAAGSFMPSGPPDMSGQGGFPGGGGGAPPGMYSYGMQGGYPGTSAPAPAGDMNPIGAPSGNYPMMSGNPFAAQQQQQQQQQQQHLIQQLLGQQLLQQGGQQPNGNGSQGNNGGQQQQQQRPSSNNGYGQGGMPPAPSMDGSMPPMMSPTTDGGPNNAQV